MIPIPAKSKKQVGKLFVLEREGKLKPGTAEEWVRATPNHGKNLPEYVPGSKAKKKAGSRPRKTAMKATSRRKVN